MKSELFQNKIIVKKSPTHGYGVFALKPIKKGETVEECYALISRRGGDKGLEDYYFDVDGKWAILLGYGCIYNHSTAPNIDYNINGKTNIAKLKATRDIRKGEELFVSYGEEYFTTRNMKEKTELTKKPKVKKKKKN